MLHWIIVLILGIGFFQSSYQQGLFYDTDIYSWHIGMALLGAAYIIYVSIKKNQTAPYYLYFAIFLIPLMYLVSYTNAVTQQGALDQFIQWTMYAVFFLVLVTARRNAPSIGQGMHILLQLFGLYIAIFPFLASWGWLTYQDAVLNGRFSSIFQYPNTYATVTMALLVFNLIYTAKNQTNIRVTILTSLPLVLYASTLFLSLSRGAMIIFPVIWLIGLMLLTTQQQLTYVLNTITAIAGGIILFMITSGSWGSSGGITQLLTLLALSAIAAAIPAGIHTLTQKKMPEKLMKKRFAFLLPAASLIAGILLIIDLLNQGWVFSKLPGNLQNRLQDIGFETLLSEGRFTFFFDAFDMLKDAPFIGWGGDGWSVLYHGYQSAPYISNEVHSVVLEQLLNIGILGFIIGAAVLLLFAVNSILSYRSTGNTLIPASLLAMLMLLGHGTIDFDFSFATVWLLFMLLLAMAVPEYPTWPKWELNHRSVHIGAYGVAAVIIALSSVYAFRFEIAERKVAELSSQTDNETILNTLDEASDWNPNKTNYIQQHAAAAVELQREDLALKLSNQFTEVEPRNSEAWLQNGNSYASFGYLKEAMTQYNQALLYDPFNIDIYQRMIRLTSGEAASIIENVENGNSENAASLASQAVDVYEKYQEKTRTFRENPESNYKDLKVTTTTSFLAGQAYMIEGSYEKGIQTLDQLGEGEGETYVRAQAMIILALEQQDSQQQAVEKLKNLKSQNDQAQAYVNAYQVFF